MTPLVFLLLLASALVLFVQACRGEWGTTVVVVLPAIIAVLIMIPLKE